MLREFFKLYEVTTDGRVINIKKDKELFGCVDSDGYKKVSPRINGIKLQLKIHRLVAMKYIPNPFNLPQVNHIDGNKLNNDVSNLEWCDSKRNINHAFEIGLSTNKHLKIKVNQLDLDGNIINTFTSFREASIITGVAETNISAVCRNYKPHNRPNSRKTAGGFIWKTCND